jgi:hypothetical protein
MEIANAAMTDLDIHVFADNDRMYTVPKAVQAEAKRALEWHKEHKRGGTPVGMNTARTLAEGGQIGIRKIRHIAKYFPRHEVDKKGTGYKPAEKGYPSNGRIAWALWGGDAAQRWASAIVERENKKSASIYEDHEAVSRVNLSDFSTRDGFEQTEQEFAIRLFADGSGFDRLYKRDISGSLSVWDSGEWSDLGDSYTKFSDIDAEIDFEAIGPDDDQVGRIRIPMDARFIINDGQHRCAGIAKAIEQNPALGEHTISILLFPWENKDRVQQMFSDLNRFVQKTSK